MNPVNTREPYFFTDEEGDIEGSAHSLLSILKSFEPVDVLNGKAVVYDSDGRKILIVTSNESIVSNNEYPADFKGISYSIGEVDQENKERIEAFAKAEGLNFID
ncbi:MAG: hypothetical protein ACREGJ_04255 [Candidatus Saccharimonadales bacterium]